MNNCNFIVPDFDHRSAVIAAQNQPRLFRSLPESIDIGFRFDCRFIFMACFQCQGQGAAERTEQEYSLCIHFNFTSIFLVMFNRKLSRAIYIVTHDFQEEKK